MTRSLVWLGKVGGGSGAGEKVGLLTTRDRSEVKALGWKGQHQKHCRNRRLPR